MLWVQIAQGLAAVVAIVSAIIAFWKAKQAKVSEKAATDAQIAAHRAQV
jgi:hypothetical protein